MLKSGQLCDRHDSGKGNEHTAKLNKTQGYCNLFLNYTVGRLEVFMVMKMWMVVFWVET
jgi:hypothetical protein